MADAGTSVDGGNAGQEGQHGPISETSLGMARRSMRAKVITKTERDDRVPKPMSPYKALSSRFLIKGTNHTFAVQRD